MNDMSKTPELLPCPFCGGEAKMIFDHNGEKHVARIFCRLSHHAFVHAYGETKDKAQPAAINKWNTRVYPPEVQAAIDRDAPKKPVRKKEETRTYSNMLCPSCGAHQKHYYEWEKEELPFCLSCGQRLDWSEE